MLRVIKRLKDNYSINIKATFLGAHAVPANYKGNKEAYLQMLIDEVMPKVAAENLAEYVDVFCETGYFSVEDTELILEAGKKYTNINNVLDIGSGNGHFLFSVQQNQIDYLGIEPSTQKVENSKKIGVNKVLNVGLEELLDNNYSIFT